MPPQYLEQNDESSPGSDPLTPINTSSAVKGKCVSLFITLIHSQGHGVKRQMLRCISCLLQAYLPPPPPFWTVTAPPPPARLAGVCSSTQWTATPGSPVPAPPVQHRPTWPKRVRPAWSQPSQPGRLWSPWQLLQSPPTTGRRSPYLCRVSETLSRAVTGEP